MDRESAQSQGQGQGLSESGSEPQSQSGSEPQSQSQSQSPSRSGPPSHSSPASSVAGAHQPGDADTRTLLSVYLNDHLAGAVGGTALARRLARGHRGTDFEAELQQIAEQIRDDLDSLRQIMNRLGIRPVWYKAPLAMVTERVSRLKLNGQLRGRSPLSTLIELEAMQLGVHGKTSGWRTLRELADTVPGLDPEQLDRLLERAHDQLDRLERMRVTAAGRALGRMDHQHPG